MNDVYLYWFDILNRILQTCFGEFSAKYHTLYELERAESCNLQILYPIATPPKNPKFEMHNYFKIINIKKTKQYITKYLRGEKVGGAHFSGDHGAGRRKTPYHAYSWLCLHYCKFITSFIYVMKICLCN